MDFWILRNVRTLRDTGSRPKRSTALVVKEFHRYGIDIAALNETRFEEEGSLTESLHGYTFYWKSRHADMKHEAGVGFAIRSSIKLDSQPKGISDRLMLVRTRLSEHRKQPSSAHTLRQ